MAKLLNYKEFLETDITAADIEKYYATHTAVECRSHFCIGKKVWYRVVKHFNIKLRDSYGNKQFMDSKTAACYKFIANVNKEEFEQYYRTHSRDDILAHFNITGFTFYKALELLDIELNDYKTRYELEKQQLMKKFGVENTFQLESSKETSKYTMLEKYGVENYSHTEEFHKKASKKYKYDGLRFDSSWELAVYMYAKAHNEDIIRIPCRYMYYSNGKKHYYFPDFKYRGNIIEIKGDYLLEDDTLTQPYACDEADKVQLRDKYNCIIANNVQIWTLKDVQYALDWCVNNQINLKKYKVN